MDILSFTQDLLLAIEILGIQGMGFPESKVRHAVSMACPLGTDSESIDCLAQAIVLALLSTGLVYRDNGLLCHMVQGGTPVAAYEPDNVTLN